ncbi:MAG: LysE family transporter [Polyangiaceae bacterium]|nr:LysE family transporter [Polyangiaceae bacterium]
MAESGYVALAFWGFGELSARYAEFARWSGPVSGAILIVLGALMARRKTRAVRTEASASSAPGHAALRFLLVALNPAFLATWSLLASALVSARLIEPASGAAPALAAGAFLGIVLWFALVASIAERQRARFDPRKVEVCGFAGSVCWYDPVSARGCCSPRAFGEEPLGDPVSSGYVVHEAAQAVHLVCAESLADERAACDEGTCGMSVTTGMPSGQ